MLDDTGEYKVGKYSFTSQHVCDVHNLALVVQKSILNFIWGFWLIIKLNKLNEINQKLKLNLFVLIVSFDLNEQDILEILFTFKMKVSLITLVKAC